MTKYKLRKHLLDIGFKEDKSDHYIDVTFYKEVNGVTITVIIQLNSIVFKFNTKVYSEPIEYSIKLDPFVMREEPGENIRIKVFKIVSHFFKELSKVYLYYKPNK